MTGRPWKVFSAAHSDMSLWFAGSFSTKARAVERALELLREDSMFRAVQVSVQYRYTEEHTLRFRIDEDWSRIEQWDGEGKWEVIEELPESRYAIREVGT